MKTSTTKIKGSKAKNFKGKTDWNKLKKITDADIKVATMNDPDSNELRDDELAKFRKEHKK